MTVGLGVSSLTSTPAASDFTIFNTTIQPRGIDYALFFMTFETDPVLWPNYGQYAAAVNAEPIATISSSLHTATYFGDGSKDTTGLRGNFGLTGLANTAKNLGYPIILRPFHEFNGSFHSYGYTHETAAAFVNAWRHIHDVFTNTGFTDVRWFWSPNIWGTPSETTNTVDPTDWYPGDAYVDIVGLDGYMTVTNTIVHTPHDLFAANLATLRSIAPSKPIALGEFGCAAQARLSQIGGKNGWYDDLFDMIRSDFPDMLLVVQWQRNNAPNDYTISSSGADPAALEAFVTGVNTPVFTDGSAPGGGGYGALMSAKHFQRYEVDAKWRHMKRPRISKGSSKR